MFCLKISITYFYGTGTGSTSPSLTVSNHAIVRAENGISAYQGSYPIDKPTPSGTGIVFDGNAGAVYGNVTLQADLTIESGETLTIPSGASLDMGGHAITVKSGGKLEGTPSGGTVNYAPTITTQSLPGGTAGTAYHHTLEATGDTPITWSVTGGALPDGLTLNENTGEISGTPATANTYNFTVTATNSSGSDSEAFTIAVTPTPTYTVTYAPGANGTGAQQTDTKTQGAALTLAGALFTREGYAQTGWATADGGAKAYDLFGSYTADAPITLYPVWAKGLAITAWPADQYVMAGERATFTVEAVGEGLTYQWYIDRGEGWQAIPGATDASYTTGAVDAACGGFRYRCEVRDAHGGALTSEAATLYVTEAVTLPMTGDTGRPGLSAALLAVCGAALCALGRRRMRA